MGHGGASTAKSSRRQPARRQDHAAWKTPGDPAAGHREAAASATPRGSGGSSCSATTGRCATVLPARTRRLDPARRRADRRIDGRCHRDRPPLDHRQLESADRPRLQRREPTRSADPRGVEPVARSSCGCAGEKETGTALPRLSEGTIDAAAARQSMPWESDDDDDRRSGRRRRAAAVPRSGRSRRRRRWRPRWRRPRRRRPRRRRRDVPFRGEGAPSDRSIVASLLGPIRNSTVKRWDGRRREHDRLVAEGFAANQAGDALGAMGFEGACAAMPKASTPISAVNMRRKRSSFCRPLSRVRVGVPLARAPRISHPDGQAANVEKNRDGWTWSRALPDGARASRGGGRRRRVRAAQQRRPRRRARRGSASC